ncbi:MAG: HAD-IB family hydrolase [Saprospiraceae bacterium]
MHDVLNDATFQQTLAQLAAQTGEDLFDIKKEAEGYLKELYTEQQPLANAFTVETVEYLLSRAYDKNIDVDPAEMRQVARLMRKHPIAFVMTHKTYIDMAILGLVLARYGLPIPYIFAGINLRFTGLAQVGQNNGLIFIRRSFKDNLVYKATLRHYIATVLNQRGSFMWSIEGTRSRTGKLVWPQMGILKYIMEAEQASTQEVKYVPVSIVYDLIPDVKEMTLEGRGKKKQAENLAWMIDYTRKLSRNLGRISIRFGEPVAIAGEKSAPIPEVAQRPGQAPSAIPQVAFELVHRINRVTPVTTTSLVCISLLSKFALHKRAIESDVAALMEFIETHQSDALVDRGQPISASVQKALNLLNQEGMFLPRGKGQNARYTLSSDQYLQTTYYANMAVQHLYHRAFIELALVKIARLPLAEREFEFWQSIMHQRSLFKFEFFYSGKEKFTEEVERDMRFITPDWRKQFLMEENDLLEVLKNRKMLLAPVVLYNYIEAYRVVAQGLMDWDVNEEFDEKEFVQFCMSLGEELNWQGRIHRIESVSRPFLVNGIRLAKNRKLFPSKTDRKTADIQRFIDQLDELADNIGQLQKITLDQAKRLDKYVPVERNIAPGSKTESLTSDILAGETGPHIAAYFDLDRTLIRDFSVKSFAQNRLLSGKFTSRELVSQVAGGIAYAVNNDNFAGLAAISAKGVTNIDEQVFIDVGEEVYLKNLARSVIPESRALVAAHLAMGHTVAIVSAATPYQVDPVARDLGIEHVMCTRMEVRNGKFTGNLIEPACWGNGKAYYGKQFAEQNGIDLQKSYFYTDSDEDMPLLEIVGNPRPVNPNNKLSSIAFQNGWPVMRFNAESSGNILTNAARTALTAGAMMPAAAAGVLRGLVSFSKTDGVNSMTSTFGDLATMMAGISLSTKGQKHLETRPAVFIMNHQSAADMLIAAKLIRHDMVGIAKKELKNVPVLGQMLQLGGAIFVDRSDREKAIEAMQPAVDALQSGTSVVIFPEGTRSNGYRLGKFKKGAFHLSMQAGVPIVPIILKNAHDAMPKNSAVFRPTLVKVVVLPPINTDDWDKENMDAHILEVRKMFLKELGQG